MNQRTDEGTDEDKNLKLCCARFEVIKSENDSCEKEQMRNLGDGNTFKISNTLKILKLWRSKQWIMACPSWT